MSDNHAGWPSLRAWISVQLENNLLRPWVPDSSVNRATLLLPRAGAEPPQHERRRMGSDGSSGAAPAPRPGVTCCASRPQKHESGFAAAALTYTSCFQPWPPRTTQKILLSADPKRPRADPQELSLRRGAPRADTAGPGTSTFSRRPCHGKDTRAFPSGISARKRPFLGQAVLLVVAGAWPFSCSRLPQNSPAKESR